MKLIDVHSTPEAADVLWRVLADRPEVANISHKRMPTWEEHCAFVESKPYAHWYLIDAGDFVGATYITRQRELGIGVMNCYRGNGYGRNALVMMMEKHPGQFLANIAPNNLQSQVLFQQLGFNLIQYTYSR